MDRNLPDVKNEAQQHATLLVGELIELNGWALNKISLGEYELLGYDEYDALRRKYYEVLANAADIVPVDPQDYVLPDDSVAACKRVNKLVSRLKHHDFYKVGRKKGYQLPVPIPEKKEKKSKKHSHGNGRN